MIKKLTPIIICLVILLTACGEPQTLEQSVESNADMKSRIEQMFDNTGLDASTSIKGNSINIAVKLDDSVKNFDLTKENKKILIGELDSNFKNKESEFSKALKAIEEETGVEGVTINIVVTHKDKEIWSIIYTKDGIYKDK